MPADFQFKPRTYLHFDLPMSKERAEALASDTDSVAAHSFYPFLGYTITTVKITKDEHGKIQKRNKERDIKIAAHQDAAIYAYYSHLLSARYEEQLVDLNLGECVRAFRSTTRGGTNIQFAGEVFDFTDSHRPCVALGFDIEGFFDNLNHEYLKEAWKRTLGVTRLPDDHFRVFKSLTDFCWVERAAVFKEFGISVNNPKALVPAGDEEEMASRRKRICSPGEFRSRVRASGYLKKNLNPGKGIPQGSPISALLSNLYMLDFDRVLEEAVTAEGGLYRRYCDDIMIVVPPSAEVAIRRVVQTQIQALGLSINEGKTDRALFPSDRGHAADKAIQYLGFTYNGAMKQLRLSSLNRYYGKMRHGVALAKQTQRKWNRLEAMSGSPLSALKRTKLHLQYSYLIGRRSHRQKGDPKANGNFLTYAYRAAKFLRAPEIKRQVRNHWNKLNEEIEKPISGQVRLP